jgi:ubiquinone/menaquinone biosynthesis C-methylase UbiE
MLDLADFQPSARILDVCCGEGATVEMLLSEGFDAGGVDLELSAEGLPVRRGSAYELPCESSSLDGIFCECGFSLLEPDGALAEFSRALKPGGALLLSDLYSRAGGGCLGNLRVHARAALEPLLGRYGFELECFEDRTDALRRFLAQFIMEHGYDEIRGAWGLNQEQAKRIQCGYFLSLSRKRPGPECEAATGKIEES